MPAPRLIVGLLGALAALASTACGREDPSPDTVRGDVLTIYSSSPLSGYTGDRARDIVDAQRLALREASGRVGRWRVRYRPLDDSDPRTGQWSPGLVTRNARRAAQDPTTIAYLGELGPGGSAVAIPLLNQLGVLTVSPLDGVAGLTSRRGASGPGEPQKYYPARRRTFARLVPSDDVQAAALLAYMQDEGVSRLYLTHDESLYGRSLALTLQRTGPARGVTVVASQDLDPRVTDPRPVATGVRSAGADGFMFAGDLRPGLGLLYRSVHDADPRVALFAPSALAGAGLASTLGPAAPRLRVTAPMLPARVLTGPGAEAFQERFRAAYRRSPDPAAVYGYEAMAVALAAIRRVGPKGNRRPAVVDAFFATGQRSSVLGDYAIDRNGDVDTRTYGAYGFRDGRLAFRRVLDPFGV